MTTLPLSNFCTDDVTEYLLQQNSAEFTESLRWWFTKIAKTSPLLTTLRVNPAARNLIESELIPILNEQYQLKANSNFKFYFHETWKNVLIIENVIRCPSELEQEAIVGHDCACSILRGSDAFASGVRTITKGTKKFDVVSIYADIDKKCTHGLETIFSGRKHFVGNGMLYKDRYDLFVKYDRTGLAIKLTDPLIAAPSLNELPSFLAYPQNFPSIVCTYMLDPQPGETVLDMCAAPGGKTQHIASLLASEGRLVAIDKAAKKIPSLEKALKDWNINNVEVYCYDSVNAWKPDSVASGSPPYPSCTFNRILLDAPCSALGQRPKFIINSHLNQIKSFPVIQKKLFKAAVPLLKLNGVLVYSTCTFTLQENESVVAWALRNFPELKLEVSPFDFGFPGFKIEDLTEADCKKLKRFGFTPDQHMVRKDVSQDTIGFFIARFRKTESVKNNYQ